MPCLVATQPLARREGGVVCCGHGERRAAEVVPVVYQTERFQHEIGIGQIQNCVGRISVPVLDRIDIDIEVPTARFRAMTAPQPGESSAAIRVRVVAARQRQRVRFAGKKITCKAGWGQRS